MVRYGIIVWGSLLLLSGAGCGKSGVQEAESAERGSPLYRKAFAAEQSGDLKEAIRLYNRVLIEEPRSFSAHFQLATLLHDHAEDYVGAIYHYNQYLYLRPEAEKSTLAQDRIRIAEQLLAPQILRKVGDSVQGISQAHLLKENDRLNRLITTLEGEKSMLVESKTAAEQERTRLQAENERLRDLLRKMRVEEVAAPEAAAGQAAQAARDAADTRESKRTTDARTLRALREEAAELAAQSEKPQPIRKPVVDAPTTESVLRKVQSRLTGGSDDSVPAARKEQSRLASGSGDSAPAAQTVAPPPPIDVTPDKDALSALSLFGQDGRKEKRTRKAGAHRTYVVQPGDTLFRVAERFYGDSTQWKRIRDANRGRIDADGRIRAGQIIEVP
ncbi:MAG TPA: LysM peptidoglycan-binding domain-containing protein [Kiritimatiellia bacterium]|nr:LysM peptidoglycan-binding domain-containing protein [Kiritimatiellia bacterium]HPK36704.1 LysM peptidoglycan-binding domain-containing protein [Kiritimatiellia bacterium]HRU19933.1 LysM peptidoglycan-binding domain-containing protein [Kiritimatiellia bacterium]